jgi:hypothetical protein
VNDDRDDRQDARQDRAEEHSEGQDERLGKLEGPSGTWRVDKGSDTESRLTDLEDNEVGAERRRKTDRWIVGCTILCVLSLIGVIFVSTTVLLNKNEIDEQQRQAKDSDLGSCKQKNDIRRAVNRDSVVIYFVLQAAAAGNEGSPRQDERDSAEQFARFANAVVFLRQIDCDAWRADPVGYETPRSVPMRALEESQRVQVLVTGSY